MKTEKHKEQQNVEWKAEWKEEYLKWICGFANAQGGKIYIGKDDKGETVGVNIAYMDEIHGSLISQAEKVIDLLFTKYLTADITYEGVTRIETYPFSKAAIREAVYNAIVHKNYATQIPIQISVYKDKLYISNDCILPAGLTIETLMGEYRSKPFNPNIANGLEPV